MALLAFQSLDHFLDDLGNRDVSLICLPVNEIERILPQANVELMFAARGLPLAAA